MKPLNEYIFDLAVSQDFNTHIVRDGDMVLETVSQEDGQEIGGVAGRMVNPGHVIECGWFLLDWANRFVIND